MKTCANRDARVNLQRPTHIHTHIYAYVYNMACVQVNYIFKKFYHHLSRMHFILKYRMYTFTCLCLYLIGTITTATDQEGKEEEKTN